MSREEKLQRKRQREADCYKRLMDKANMVGDGVRKCFICDQSNPTGKKIVFHFNNKYSFEKYQALDDFDFVQVNHRFAIGENRSQ